MTPKEAQSVAERYVNMLQDSLTIREIKQALVVLANFYEDHKNDSICQGDSDEK